MVTFFTDKSPVFSMTLSVGSRNYCPLLRDKRVLLFMCPKYSCLKQKGLPRTLTDTLPCKKSVKIALHCKMFKNLQNKKARWSQKPWISLLVWTLKTAKLRQVTRYKRLSFNIYKMMILIMVWGTKWENVCETHKTWDVLGNTNENHSKILLDTH